MERRIVHLRRWLRIFDPLGYVGADAIKRKLLLEGLAAPCTRTIVRVLDREGLLHQRRRRHPAPPPGWYLSEVRAGRAELDELDIVEGLHLRGAGPLETLTAVSLWGKLVFAAPSLSGWRIDSITACLAEHWQRWGAPAYLQMDNDTRFAGSTRAVRRLGRFIRFCLSEGVIPVFAPPRETGFQAAVESFNALWQAKVWQRFRHRNLHELQIRNTAFLDAHRQLAPRDSIQRSVEPRPATSQVVFLRRTDARGRIWLLGAQATVDPNWPHRLVRADLNIADQTLRCHSLRRRDPAHQPLIKTMRFTLHHNATF